MRKILKHGSLTLGFIGLAETLKALIGEHHGESEEAQKLGLEIIGHMREVLDGYSEQYKLNFTCLGTPAEGLSGRFTRIDPNSVEILDEYLMKFINSRNGEIGVEEFRNAVLGKNASEIRLPEGIKFESEELGKFAKFFNRFKKVPTEPLQVVTAVAFSETAAPAFEFMA